MCPEHCIAAGIPAPPRMAEYGKLVRDGPVAGNPLQPPRHLRYLLRIIEQPDEISRRIGLHPARHADPEAGRHDHHLGR